MLCVSCTPGWYRGRGSSPPSPVFPEGVRARPPALAAWANTEMEKGRIEAGVLSPQMTEQICGKVTGT